MKQLCLDVRAGDREPVGARLHNRKRDLPLLDHAGPDPPALQILELHAELVQLLRGAVVNGHGELSAKPKSTDRELMDLARQQVDVTEFRMRVLRVKGFALVRAGRERADLEMALGIDGADLELAYGAPAGGRCTTGRRTSKRSKPGTSR